MAEKNMNAEISVEFEEATSRQSLNTGDNVKTLFGKLKKWLADLKPVAFSGSYNDLSDKPESTGGVTPEYISKQVFGNGATEETVPASGTWEVPEGVHFIDVFLIGGGGSAMIGTRHFATGPNVLATTYFWGSCGGGGYTAFRQGIPVSPGENLTITIGAGGAAATVSGSSTGTSGGAQGGATTIKRGSTVLATAAGGKGGINSTAACTVGGFGGNVGASPSTAGQDSATAPGYTAYEVSRCYNPRNGKYYANGGNVAGKRSTGGYGDGGNSFTKETVTESSSSYTKILATAGFSGACLIYY